MTEVIPDNQQSLDGELLDNLKGLDEEQKTEVMATMEMYSGPLPHPSILKQYKDLYPQAAEEIIKNGLAESKHRRRLENSRVWTKLLLSAFTLVVFAVLSYLFLKWSVDLIKAGHKVIGSIFGGGSFLMILGTLLSLVQTLTQKDDLKSSSDE